MNRHLSDLAGAWLMREAELRIIAGGQVASLTPPAKGLAPQERGSMVVVPIYGVLSKSTEWWSSGMTYGDIRQRIRRAAVNPDVSSILLHIDSPGGNSAGV